MVASLGDIIRERFGGLVPPSELEPSPLDLARLPKTETLQRAVESLRGTLLLLGEDDPSRSAAAPRLESRLERAERDLANGRRRDAIDAERRVLYAGCWCLGAGGRGECGVPVPTDAVDGDGRTVVEVVEAFRETCQCPEGVAAAARAAEAHERRGRWIVSKRVDRAWAGAQIPTANRDHTLATWLERSTDPDATAKVALLRAWLATERWLILTGQYGAGKTGVLVALLRELAAAGPVGQSVLFVNAPAMLRRVRATFDRGSEGPSEQEVVATLAEVDVLGLDDIGKERLSEWGQELLYDVINRRYSEQRRTIVTTNLPLRATSEGVPSLESHVQAATFWRLFERSHPMTLVGNLRMAGAR